MELLAVHPHAFKHGLTEADIRCAWRNAFCWARRDRDDGKVDYVLVGPCPIGRIVELIARRCGEDEFIVFHANTPPTKRVLTELHLFDR